MKRVLNRSSTRLRNDTPGMLASSVRSCCSLARSVFSMALRRLWSHTEITQPGGVPGRAGRLTASRSARITPSGVRSVSSKSSAGRAAAAVPCSAPSCALRSQRSSASSPGASRSLASRPTTASASRPSSVAAARLTCSTRPSPSAISRPSGACAIQPCSRPSEAWSHAMRRRCTARPTSSASAARPSGNASASPSAGRARSCTSVSSASADSPHCNAAQKQPAQTASPASQPVIRQPGPSPSATFTSFQPATRPPPAHSHAATIPSAEAPALTWKGSGDDMEDSTGRNLRAEWGACVRPCRNVAPSR